MTTNFDISPLFSVADLVKSVTIYSNAVTSVDARGDEYETDATAYTDTAIVVPADAEADWLERGYQIDHDFVVFFKEDTSISAQLTDRNALAIDGITYFIRNVTHNPGHYELLVKR